MEKGAKDVLREVISLRNFLRPLNRFPPEAIALCATFVSPTDPRPIIPLTHVCRYWRNAITSSHKNWASIDSGRKGLVPLCLERAGVVPLTVDITVSDIKEDENFLQALLPHTSRINHLSLTGYSSIEDVARDLPDFFVTPMFNPTSLELEQTEEPIESFLSDATPTHPLFQNVSKLKSIRFTRTPLYPAITSIRSLVELKLVGYTTPFDFKKFIGFLRSNPNLEIIVLDIQFIETPLWILSTMTFPLACLRQLSFTCAHAIDAKGLISHISFPRGVILEILGSRTNLDADLHLFLPSPPTKIQELLTPITVVKFQNTPSREVQFSGNGSLFSFRSSNTSFNLDPAFDLFPTTAVHEFHAKVSPCREVLFQPLSQLPALETLVFVDVTSFPTHSLDFLGEDPVLCPSLKTVAFFDCGLGSGIIGDLENVVARRQHSTAARLYRVVIVNRAGKLPDYKSIRRLRQFVPRVDVGIDELPDLP